MSDPVVMCTIAQFARLTRRERQRRTVFREILWYYARDVEEFGKCDWLTMKGPRCKIRLNLTRLERAHPELFTYKAATHDEVEELKRRVEVVEREVGVEPGGKRSLAARVKRLEVAGR